MYEISEEIKAFNKKAEKDGVHIEYKNDKFFIEKLNEDAHVYKAFDFIRDKLKIITEYKDKKTDFGYINTVDTQTMNILDKIWDELGEEFYRHQIHHGMMNQTHYDPEDNDLLLNLRNYNEETINKIKKAIGAKRWYMVFDGWAEDMYIVYQF